MHPLRRDAPVTSQCTRYVAMHPLRCNAPVTSRYTRYVALHPIRRGAMPTDRVQRLPQQAQPRAIRPHRPQPPASDAATQLQHARPAPNERRYTRYVALHPLRRNAPDQKRCNAYRSGAPPPTTSTTAGNSPPQTPTARLRRCGSCWPHWAPHTASASADNNALITCWSKERIKSGDAWDNASPSRPAGSII